MENCMAIINASIIAFYCVFPIKKIATTSRCFSLNELLIKHTHCHCIFQYKDRTYRVVSLRAVFYLAAAAATITVVHYNLSIPICGILNEQVASIFARIIPKIYT